MADGLHVEISDSGREIFDALIPDVTGIGAMDNPPVVTYASALGALRDFCQGVGGTSPDIVLTTRRLRASFITECGKNGVDHIAQVELGRGALVLAVRSGSPLTQLTARQVYLALARDVPDKDEFRRNTAIRWSDIDKSLPQLDIRFQLPPREDGGRAVFNALILEGGCRQEPLVNVIFSAEQRTARCVTTRFDRVREIPPAQRVKALLEAPEGTVGVISYLDLVQSEGKLTGLGLDGAFPTHDAIVQGTYDYHDLYYLYAKRGQALQGRGVAVDAAVDRIISRSLTEPVIGPNGILAKAGLIPLPDEDRNAQRAIFSVRRSFDVTSTVLGWVGSAADGARSLLELGFGIPQPPAPDGALDFTSLMELAGYKTQEFQTSVGIIPSAGMTFGIVREMSEADQDYLARKLDQDSHLRAGAVPSLQRNIVRSVLDVSETAGYEISRVEIELLPLPSVKLIVAPTDGPVSQETTSILRAIERLNDRHTEAGQ